MQEITRNIEWEFTDKKVTPWGGMRMFKQFLDQSGIREQLRAAGLPQPMSNCGYDPVMMMESFRGSFEQRIAFDRPGALQNC